MNRVVKVRAVTAIALVTLAGGCGDKAPKGQVLAIVNGSEVTRRELMVEPEAALLKGGDAGPPVSALLDSVIDRKVAVDEARRLGLDRTPEFLARSSRVGEVLLSRALFDRWVAEMPAPGRDALGSYAARNRQAFAGRKLLLADRIDTTADAASAADLAPLRTMEEIAALLQERGKSFQRTRAVLDTATTPLPLYRQLLAADPGYPMALPQGERLSVLAVLESRDAPVTGAEAADQALQGLRQAEVQRRLADLRRSAKVAYQAGYTPPPRADTAAGAGGGAQASQPTP